MAKASNSKVPPKKKTIKPFEFESIDESLTDRQKLFCMYYTGECKFNGAKAAEMAGYEQKNAASYAVYLLKNPNISQFIDSCKKDLGLRIGVTAEMIAREYAKIAFSNIQDFVQEGNEVSDVTTIDRGIASAVHSVKRTKTTFGEDGEKEVVEIKLHDKISGLKNLSQMIGVDGASKIEMKVNPIGTDVENEEKYI